MKYYLDTNICIYFLKGTYPKLLAKMLSCNPNDIKIPSIVKAELIYRAMKSNKKTENLEKINRFLMPLEIITFDESAAYRYGEIRAALEKNGMIIGPNDLIIAASVLSGNGVLITNNTKEFSRVSGIQLQNWTVDE